MMDSLQDILDRKKFTPPDEIEPIKDYVRRKYKAACSVKFQRGAIIVSVPNSALAATMQLERQKMVEACKLGGKRLVIRNGQ
ncbi:MAG TPA: hypothetical protein VI336_03410 [Candidatus Saccharimonadales bacterium]|nr:hypothetical protein [Candidatus Saccharimonadales bacterium]